MWIFKEYAEENRRINSVKEDTERADGTVRIVMSAPFLKNYKMKCERYLNESAFRTFFCFKQ